MRKYLQDQVLPTEGTTCGYRWGWPLGLELAAALKNRNVNISIIQRAPRFNGRQLGPIASSTIGKML